jgi:hypothetical protein
MITNTDLLPQRYHFLLGMVKDLNVFPFDNISLPQEVRGIFVIKAAVEMQNNLPFCD